MALINEDEMTNLSTCFIAVTTRCESDLKVYRRQGKQCNIHKKIELQISVGMSLDILINAPYYIIIINRHVSLFSFID